MSEGSIGAALDKLEASTISARGEGLEDLKRILGSHRGNSGVDSLGDEGFYKIFETLFRVVRIEKAAWTAASTKTAVTSRENRLETCSSAFRLTVDAGSTRIKHKTAAAVLKHIIEILPVKLGGFCPPLCNDYMKGFRSLLQYPSHGEHLRPKQWHTLIDFVIENLEYYSFEAEPSSNGTNSWEASVPRSGSRLSVRPSQASHARKSRSDANTHIEELVTSLRLLTGVSNAPLASKANDIINCLLIFLTTTKISHEAAFEALNNVLFSIRTEDVTLTRDASFRAIPFVRRLWSTKSGALRDQLLIFLMSVRSLFEGPQGENADTDERQLLDDLFRTVVVEYGKRHERDCLQIEDIYFPHVNDILPLRLLTLAPVAENSRAVANWACVSILADLAFKMDNWQIAGEKNFDSEVTSRKRRKVGGYVDELFHEAQVSNGSERLCAIQTLMFMLDHSEKVALRVAEHVSRLANGIDDDNISISSWTLLFLSRFAFTSTAAQPNLHSFWTQTWNRASHCLSNQGTCRAACHFLDSLLKAELFRDFFSASFIEETLFSNGMSGPCSISDAALSLWRTALTSGLSNTPEMFNSFSLKAIAWLNTHWTLPAVLDRLQNAYTASHAREDRVHMFLMACVNKDMKLKQSDLGIITSPIYRFCLQAGETAPLANYLLLVANTQDPIVKAELPRSSFAPIDASVRSRVEHAATEVLFTKLKTFRDAWTSLQSERATNVSIDVMQILSSLCIVVSAFHAVTGNLKSISSREIRMLTDELWAQVCTFISSQTGDFRQHCIVTIAASLLRVRTEDAQQSVLLARHQSALLVPIHNLMKQALKERESTEHNEDDLMDLGDSFVIQNSQITNEVDSTQTLRQKSPFAMDLQSAMVQMTTKILIDQVSSSQTTDGDPNATSAVIDFATSLTPGSLVAARFPMTAYFETSPNVTRTDACRLLESLAETCLQNPEFERCETALCFCVDVLGFMARLWSTGEEDNLASVASDIYAWYLDIALGKGIATQRVLLGIGRVLEAVLANNPAFGAENSLPSPRTSLLQIIKVGDHLVQFKIAEIISCIFDRFVLSEHDAIFDDVLESLPSDPERIEGIAVRLFVLAKLASKWHTILRRAVYHVFETASHVPMARSFAQECLHRICRALRLKRPRDLFVLFSPQILYTWLENESLDSIPFPIFGYTSLKSLLLDVQDEVVGQIAMRTNEEHAASISSLLDVSWEQLLCASFVYAEAYCVARDISMPRDEQHKGSEAIMRKQLGSEVYTKLLLDSFPQIIARLIIVASDEQGVDKILSKRKSLSAIQTALIEICKLSHSTAVLPRGQQPSFRLKYLFDEIEYLCQRIDRESSTMWEPAFIVHVCRELFDSAAPALGPLHACSVVRKVRIVVCLAGLKAAKGYQLEMLLQTLKPYLTDFHCSGDALGLFWYLLDHGKAYLQLRLPFITSIAVSTLASLTTFLASSQDSTTQESHFQATMTKAQKFRDWFTKYLDSFIATDSSRDTITKFKKIVKSSSSLTQLGSNARCTSEGDLLYQLLNDQGSEAPLLTHSVFSQLIQLLCANFSSTADPREDILYKDVDAALFAPMLWKLLKELEMGDSFKKWVAQVAGRAYASKGQLRVDHANHHHVQSGFCSTETGPDVQSYKNILDSLAMLIRKDDHKVASLAERALQLVFSSFSTQDKTIKFGTFVDEVLIDDLGWTRFICPELNIGPEVATNLKAPVQPNRGKPLESWACHLAIALCGKVETDSVLTALPLIMNAMPSLAVRLLPSIVHIVLLSESPGKQPVRQSLTTVLDEVFTHRLDSTRGYLRLALNILLYLRRHPVPRESTMADRNLWLDVNYVHAAAAASLCEMETTALLLLEIHASQQALFTSRSSRRPSTTQLDEHVELVQKVFQNLEDPDFFFGVQERADMSSVMKKLTHEESSYKNLSFQSASYDSDLKLSIGQAERLDDSAVLGALCAANLHGLARAVQMQSTTFAGADDSGNALSVSLNLNQWDLPQQTKQNRSTEVLLDVFRGLDTSSSMAAVIDRLDRGFLGMATILRQDTASSSSVSSIVGTGAVLTELRDLLSITGFDDLKDEIARHTERMKWELQENFKKVSTVLLGREATFAAIKRSDTLRTTFKLSLAEAQLLEIMAIRDSLKIGRSHGAAQFCLNRAMYLSKLNAAPHSKELKVDAAVMHDLAHILWDQGEVASSIQMLRQLQEHKDLTNQAIPVSRAEILADLGHQIAEARLGKPDDIIAEYLLPAIKELQGLSEGMEAGRVFHSFAVFCDTQLQNTDDLEEFARVERIRNNKEEEIKKMEDMIKGAEHGKKREQLKQHYTKAKVWFKLDDEDYRRLKGNREKFIAQSLENYLRSMRASDIYTNDTLRFVALWLDQSESESANVAVAKYISSVPSRKFAPLMNQLSSRILDRSDAFQRLLTDLIYRVCCDHPYHSLYQLFAASKSRGAKSDEVAASRYTAAGKLSERVMKQGSSGPIWIGIHNSSIAFVKLANGKLPEKAKSGSKMQLREMENGRKLEQTIQDAHNKIPPPTMKIALRADCDYASIPKFTRFDPSVSIAGGVSAPKIVTVIASDGSRLKMLLKGGNDDLRQDSIMEQVFEQVSNLLKDHRTTRQRHLGIRTYKVLPLTPNAGIIEFVKDTVPLHEYLLPAHQRYFPKDFKPNRCRKEIADAQTKPLGQRIQAYRTVCANFRPVMRFFFMEHFLDPDDWFAKRLAYSRSTAAISILGHVLGLGDRHGHNILLDEKTGEVVHIDLGVAFEAGRVLPVPEVVPFRLTRDLVDGMGLSGVEGVFRRCCNFTLEALRQDQYSIMTILDVLRYDPLYSWSMTPLRLQKMQEAQEQELNAGEEVVAGTRAKGRGVNEPSEADRALTVVAKKLGKSLSVEATVNELINQATDEKNLATLYCGWAAYA